MQSTAATAAPSTAQSQPALLDPYPDLPRPRAGAAGVADHVVARPQRVRPRVMFVASNGGHLAQLMGLRSWWVERERVWVSFDKPDARSRLEGEEVVWAHWPTTRNLPNLLRNFVLACGAIRRSRPDIVVSTGAAVALPFFLAARLRRLPTVYIEVYDRMDTRTMSGRLCKPLATEFLVQWPEQEEIYPGATHVGPLL
ncbi:MAG TPA: UDP-N-acetylglucosamine--LPS N-acetylglucosamine transferase [Mycobacteriales bacterium]|nr:UDP-N-acetylglucosamine--LPS N-acetylglucosamine transferase [Mycobacteriales bacterium]